MKMNEPESYLVIRAGREHLDVLLPIYEEFLGYYHRRYGSLLRDIALERKKILEYLEAQFDVDKSVVLMATIRSTPHLAAGFVLISPVVQLDGSCSQWSLKDMFVSPGHRRKGLALTLMREARDYC